jgi:hypothetical protein
LKVVGFGDKVENEDWPVQIMSGSVDLKTGQRQLKVDQLQKSSKQSKNDKPT